jgi:hypothetical protein
VFIVKLKILNTLCFNLFFSELDLIIKFNINLGYLFSKDMMAVRTNIYYLNKKHLFFRKHYYFKKKNLKKNREKHILQKTAKIENVAHSV